LIDKRYKHSFVNSGKNLLFFYDNNLIFSYKKLNLIDDGKEKREINLVRFVMRKSKWVID